MDQNHRNRLEGAHAIDAIAMRGEPTPKQVEHNPEGGHGRGMACGLTLLTMQRNGEFRLGVKAGERVLDVAEAARLLHVRAPATVDDLLQNEDGPSLHALVDAALQSNYSRRLLSTNRASRMGQS